MGPISLRVLCMNDEEVALKKAGINIDDEATRENSEIRWFTFHGTEFVVSEYDDDGAFTFVSTPCGDYVVDHTVKEVNDLIARR